MIDFKHGSFTFGNSRYSSVPRLDAKLKLDHPSDDLLPWARFRRAHRDGAQNQAMRPEVATEPVNASVHACRWCGDIAATYKHRIEDWYICPSCALNTNLADWIEVG